MTDDDIDNVEKLKGLLGTSTGAAAIGTAVQAMIPIVEEVQKGGEVILRQKDGSTKTLKL